MADFMERRPIGVLACDGDDVVGWATVALCADTTLESDRKGPGIYDLDVWSVWCTHVRSGNRGKGSHALLAGAVAFTRS